MRNINHIQSFFGHDIG